MRACSPLIELMNGTLPPLSMISLTPCSSTVGAGRVDHELHVGDAHDGLDEPRHVGDLVAAGDAAVDVEHDGAGLDLIGGESLDELGVARLDRFGDLLARPVDRFTHQQHVHNLHDEYPDRMSGEYMRSAGRGERVAAESVGGARSTSAARRRRSRRAPVRARPQRPAGDARRSGGP